MDNTSNLPEIIPSDKPKQDAVITIGYAILAISFVAYCGFDFMNVNMSNDFFRNTFFFHYLASVGYLLVLIFSGAFGVRKIWHKENIHKAIILFNIYLISAYALNKEIVIFEDSVNWLRGYLILSSLTLLSFRYFDLLPKWSHRFLYVLLGLAMPLYFYLALFVAPVYGFGTIGIIFFGIGIHSFVPLWLLIASITLVKFSYKTAKVSFHWIWIGVGLPIFLTSLFVRQWNSRISEIERITNQSVLHPDEELPVWTKVAQTIQNDWVTQRILKSNLIYTVASDHFGNWNFMPQRISWDEARNHDPFVYIASMFSKLALSNEETIKVLQAITDAHHQSQERLWAGDNLSTSYIVSDIDIYPDIHLAYTEKYLTVRNNENYRRWWGSREEAIYTFQLPEGSVVTSLSLWIEGVEKKGILTSKQKANNAYKTIVGVEQRDPSLVHWQEGNTVSVRVFPCDTKEERKFKIGITSPLAQENGRLMYKNITFRGPNASFAKETVRVSFVGEPKDVKLPSSFEMDIKGNYLSEKSYDPDLEISLNAEDLKANRFSFDGYTYSLANYQPQLKPSKVSAIYLDINNSWTKAELNKLKPLLESHKLYVNNDNEFVRLSQQNWELVEDKIDEYNFSLFPFYKIKNTTEALVITKGKRLSPHLSDIKKSVFAQKNGKYFADGKQVKVYNLDGEISTYISSLRELRGLEFANGTATELLSLLNKNQFPVTEESDSKVILHDAQLFISKTKGIDSTKANNAPDHLARLFAYNDIMRKVGPHFHDDDFINDDLVEEARSFYVVSPVSSLIVLETQQDYDRFDIKHKENSLGNASKNSSGAVPEPHEWALIILFAGLVLYAFRQSKYRFSL